MARKVEIKPEKEMRVSGLGFVEAVAHLANGRCSGIRYGCGQGVMVLKHSGAVAGGRLVWNRRSGESEALVLLPPHYVTEPNWELVDPVVKTASIFLNVYPYGIFAHSSLKEAEESAFGCGNLIETLEVACPLAFGG